MSGQTDDARMNASENSIDEVAKTIGTNAIILLGVFLSAFPIYYMTISSTFSLQQFFQFPPRLIPGGHFVENYRHLFIETLFLRTPATTQIYTTAATIGTVIVATMAGYAFSMFEFRGRKPIFALILAMMSIPFQLIAIALFNILINLGLIDTLIGGILPILIFPIVILIMKQNFDQMDIENILRSARIDGASEFQIFYHIALPVMRPAIAAATIITFLWRAGELFWPLVVFRSQEMHTVTVFIANQIGYRTSTDWTVVIPAGLILTIPSIIVAIYFQRHFVKGMMAGSTK